MIGRLRAFVVWLAAMGVVTLALLEAVVALSLRFPRFSLIPRPVLQFIYLQYDRPIIQFVPECAAYDAYLTYTLRPGRCRFGGREFVNEYYINRTGLRDDEESLEGPDTVMLGDSMTMGWGVDQHETFPSVFERLTGYRTLNAGVSSYGTVRELRLLERIDRSRLTHLVIQYSVNDVGENTQFVQKGSLKTMTREEYDRTVADHRQAMRYVPGKYAYHLLDQWHQVLKRQGLALDAAGERARSLDEEVSAFLQVLERSSVPLAGVRLTVLSDSTFIPAARRLSAASAHEWIRRIEYVDIAGLIGKAGGSYTLDDHPTAPGHAAIARELARLRASKAGPQRCHNSSMSSR